MFQQLARIAKVPAPRIDGVPVVLALPKARPTPGFKAVRVFMGLIAFTLWTAPALAQGEDWRRFMDAAMVSHQRGNYPAAEIKLKAALGLAEDFGPDDRRLVTTLTALAVVYYEQQAYGEAEPLLLRAVEIEERIVGPARPELALNLNGLALIYTHQGEYERAEPIFKRSLALLEKAFGPEHLEVARVLDSLAGVFTTLGRYGEAEPYYERVLAIFEKELGPRHPDVAKTLEFHANVLRMLGREAEAEALSTRATEITGGGAR